MDLIAGEKVLGADPKVSGAAAAVLGDIVRLVVRAATDVEAIVEAGRDAAVAGKEGVPYAADVIEQGRGDDIHASSSVISSKPGGVG